MKEYGGKSTAAQGGFVYENTHTNERAISRWPNTRSLPGKKSDWRYIGREKALYLTERHADDDNLA